MTSWADVASKVIDFLQKPSGWGTFIVVVLVLFAVYALPLAVVTWTSWDNTDRLEKAITNLGTHCFRDVALKR